MPQAVIMAGGQGERFWPLTHKAFPKYRLRFDGKTSLLRQTVSRLRKIYSASQIHVVTTEEHRRQIRQELPELKPGQIFIEPSRNNTANAITLAAKRLEATHGPDEILSFFPADHLILDTAAFKRTLATASKIAREKNLLVTIGIQPAFPATGYGYIRTGKRLAGFPDAYKVGRFVEKPDLKKARQYVKDGRFLWNGGMFVWKTRVFLDAMGQHAPKISASLNLKSLARSYKKLPNISIDVALLEKARNIAVVKTRMDWCDMGHWDMLYDKSVKKIGENFILGDVLKKDSASSLVYNLSGSPVVAFGVSDLVIVQTDRGTLVCPRGRAEEAALFFKGARAHTRH